MSSDIPTDPTRAHESGYVQLCANPEEVDPDLLQNLKACYTTVLELPFNRKGKTREESLPMSVWVKVNTFTGGTEARNLLIKTFLEGRYHHFDNCIRITIFNYMGVRLTRDDAEHLKHAAGSNALRQLVAAQ